MSETLVTDPVLKQLVDNQYITDPRSAKGKLMRAAAHLFKTRGYERTTVRELGAAVGIQSGSLFHHFKSKEDILLSVMKETIIINMARMDDALSKAPDAKSRLLALIQCEINSVHTDTGEAMSVLVYEWRSLSKDKQPLILNLRNQYEALWLSVIKEAADLGLIRLDPFILRRLIAGAIGWSSTWYRTDGDLSLEDLAKNTLLLAIKD
jgi:AcrR family transcriptional regulator